MASSIDTAKPEAGNATTASVRANFSAAKTEIEALQALMPSGAVVGTTDAQTLTNKTLTSPTINGGTISGITDLAVADGGTGASTAAGARTNLGIVSGQATLETTGTTTTVAQTAVTANSRILLFARDDDAASLEGIGAYVSAVSAGASFTITHAEYSGTRTFDYLVIG